jgi:hypothetical protein
VRSRCTNRGDLTEDLSSLIEALSWLENKSISVWVFGGWAEQLRGLCRPRDHGDIDLLYPCETWTAVDMLIADQRVEEIVAKRFAHKRAIVWRETMVEVFLVRFDDRGPHTLFLHRLRHDWPTDVLGHVGEIRVASAAALRGYRAVHDEIYAQRDPGVVDLLTHEHKHAPDA